ncbi:hypothetical protein DYBT9275_02730 [Dyadobacter sp. CECT 9275]|uniref:Uncharacterized protein n=1 Tax=Dyadobacter helix TaxID=2822344 RepID=A0A916JD62_9BACT|nr:hypothetical protein DYBT9275_02730 [Dyadobacter sp. CECT 9275]
MKTYFILRICWLPTLGLIIYLKSFAVSSLNWFASNPTMYNKSTGYLPLIVIITLAALSRKIIARWNGN